MQRPMDVGTGRRDVGRFRIDVGIVLRGEGKVSGCREDSERNKNLVNFQANADDFRKNPTQYVCAICNSLRFADAIDA